MAIEYNDIVADAEYMTSDPQPDLFPYDDPQVKTEVRYSIIKITI